MYKRFAGFTLVELLIVIVVIAVLASISTVAYSGVQQRAYSAQIATMASSYKKHFKMMYAEHGRTTIAPIPSENSICLGSPEDYPTTELFPAGACARQKLDSTFMPANNGKVYAQLDTDIYNELRSKMSNVPKVPTAKVYENQQMIYRGATIHLAENGFELSVPVPDNFVCPKGMTNGSYFTTRFCYTAEWYY